MTRTAARRPVAPPYRARRGVRGGSLLRIIHSTDPKDIGVLYLVTSFGFFLAGGLMAMLVRGELAVPGQQFLSNEQYNQLFTMHGTIMLLLYATPILFGFANYIVPLQIGSPDVAFPRLNALSYWLFLFGGLVVVSGFLTRGGAADSGWFAYTPLSGPTHSPGPGQDLWAAGLIVSGLGTILGAVNSLEWATSCPPPRHNFTELPRIRSERPAFELHYPEYVERFRTEAHVGGKPSPYEVAAQVAEREAQPGPDPASR